MAKKKQNEFKNQHCRGQGGKKEQAAAGVRTISTALVLKLIMNVVESAAIFKFFFKKREKNNAI